MNAKDTFLLVIRVQSCHPAAGSGNPHRADAGLAKSRLIFALGLLLIHDRGIFCRKSIRTCGMHLRRIVQGA